MIDLTNVKHHQAIDDLVDVLCNKTQNTDKCFFRTEVAYFLGKLASNMRATLVTKDRGEIPINIYALALATSGFGKGHSVNIMESQVISGFKQRFMEETLPTIAEKHLWEIANARAARDGTEPDNEFEAAKTEYKRAGAFPFTFDSGTTPAVKQLRQKLLLADCGAINMQIDEIGSNLISNTDVLTAFLELYDQGQIKQKLTKNTNDNQRSEEIDGKTPANMLLFGTPSKLFDGSVTEDTFYSFLDMGYARRCLFGIGSNERKAMNSLTPAEIYAKLTQSNNSAVINKYSTLFYNLANPTNYGFKIFVEDNEAIKLLEYKIACEKAADELPEHEEIKKAELSHRYFKALKLAGVFAFIDGTSTLMMDQLLSAILLVEESGKAFQTILQREKTYVKLAKYIAEIKTDVTHADLHEALPFYKSGNAARNEMMTLAMAWGYKKHILIKKFYINGIEMFKGETLQETNLDELILSYSTDWAFNYLNETAPFDALDQLMTLPGHHWCNHHLRHGHRTEENVIANFNMVVLDIDGGVSLNLVHELLKEYKFMTYTTKRHTETENRFRLILPINYILNLDSEDYKEFMQNIVNWLPFSVDEQANQRARKWETNGQTKVHYNMEGEILNALDFVPKTSLNEQYMQKYQKVESLDNLERWFAQRIAQGNRNNQMLRYAMALADTGLDLPEVQNRVKTFNSRIKNPIPDSEIDSTIMKSVAKKYITP